MHRACQLRDQGKLKFLTLRIDLFSDMLAKFAHFDPGDLTITPNRHGRLLCRSVCSTHRRKLACYS
jgi:hypothetical protein